MKVAKDYQLLLEKAFTAIKSGEPSSFIGMYDCGKNYLFSLLSENFIKNPITTSVLCLNFIKGTYEEFVKILSLELAFTESIKSKPNSQDKLISLIRKVSQKKKICLVVNIAYGVKIDKKIVEIILSLRNLLGWNFNYLIFANCGFFIQNSVSQAIFDKVFKKNLIPILPLSKSGGRQILTNYEERYQKKIAVEKEDLIIQLAGGNPGFIKGLYLQAMESANWQKPDVLDERLYYRIDRLIKELPNDYINQFSKASYINNNNNANYFLSNYGYINKDKKPFSQLLNLYFNTAKNKPKQLKIHENTDDLITTLLTVSERRVFKQLQNSSGKIISKDDIAQTLWGESWADKYSDWAIDQLIHTLRLKLASIPQTGKITTKKGEGYIFVN